MNKTNKFGKHALSVSAAFFPAVMPKLSAAQRYIVFARGEADKRPLHGDETALIILGGLFMLAGLAFILWRVYIFTRAEVSCTETVTAVCVRIEPPANRNSLSKPVWEYYYNGREYHTSEYCSDYKLPRLYDSVKLRIDPDDPEKVYRRDIGAFIVLITVGVMFMLIGAAMITTILSEA